MKFGIREICNVVFRAKTKQKLGSRTFYKNEPVLYFDTLKTSNLEGAATTVYAQGGRGNPRLIAWEGERTLTFTMEDALLSPEGLAILTGAGLIDAKEANNGHGMFVHTTDTIEVEADNTIVLPEDFACWTGGATSKELSKEEIDKYQNDSADIFIMVMDDDGNIVSEPCIPARVEYSTKTNSAGKKVPQTTITCYSHEGKLPKNTIVFVDYYVRRTTKATQIEISADKFGGSYYIEADTLFRRNGDNYDMPATFVIPNGKVQSNFTFAMANTGDPSTFTFTVDAMPDYTKFDRTHKILAGILLIEDEDEDDDGEREVCYPGVTTTAKGATVTTLKNTASEAQIEISGVAVEENASSNDLFNLNGELTGKNAMVADVTLEPGEQIVRQINPALANYETDSNVEEIGGKWTKIKKYNIDNLDTAYSFLVMEDTPEITIEIIKGGTLMGTTLTGGTVEKKYTIKSNVRFA